MITSPAHAIKQLGGSMAVTRQLGLPYTTVASWIARQSIPVEMWPRLVSVATGQGVSGFTYDALVQAHTLKVPRRNGHGRATPDPRLEAFAERIERVLDEAKDAGFDARTLRKVIAARRRKRKAA